MTSKIHTSPTPKIIETLPLPIKIIQRINIKATNIEAISRKVQNFSKTKIHLWHMTNILRAIECLINPNVELISTLIWQLLYNNRSWEWKNKWAILSSNCALIAHQSINKYVTLVGGKEPSSTESNARNSNAVDAMAKDLVINANIAMANLMCLWMWSKQSTYLKIAIIKIYWEWKDLVIMGLKAITEICISQFLFNNRLFIKLMVSSSANLGNNVHS